MRALVVDIDELGAPELKAALSALAAQLRAGGDLDALADEVGRQHGGVLAFAERARDYLTHRDAELHRIIQVLSDGLAGVSQGAAAYHRRLLENGTRLEAASRLSDLVQMSAAITEEVQGLRTAVAERRMTERVSVRISDARPGRASGTSNMAASRWSYVGSSSRGGSPDGSGGGLTRGQASSMTSMLGRPGPRQS